MTTYDEYQNQPSSEKLALAVVEASKRLIGWVLHSGSVYKLTDFDYAVLVSVEDSGVAYTGVASVGAVTAGKYFHDRENRTLYLRASDSSNPNGRFLVLTFQMFFANAPVIAPHDLSTGFDVEWLPLLKGTSAFGVEIGTEPEQLGIAIEGQGTVSFYCDKDFWRTRYDKLVFENNRVFIYSWNRALPITEAQLLFRGRIQEKSYSLTTVSFRLKDFFNVLRSRIQLPFLGSVVGAKAPLNYLQSKKRLAYGFVDGFVPQNIDQVIDTGYPLSGTLTGNAGDLTLITGSGTAFLTDLRPGDQIFVPDTGLQKTVQSIQSDVSLRVGQALSTAEANALAALFYRVKPNLAKRYTNRSWQLTDHALREPQTTILSVSAPGLYRVGSTTDFEIGDLITIGTDLVTVKNLVGTDRIRIEGTLSAEPAPGTTVTRLSVTNVMINESTLLYARDYTYNATTGQLTLTGTAERNISPTRTLSGTLNYQIGTTQVLGTGTQFTTELDVNSWIPDPNGSFTNPTFVEVLSIESDTELHLKTNPGLGGVVSQSQVPYKRPTNYREGTDRLTCSLIGATDDGLPSGVFLRTAPQAAADLLSRAGLASEIDTASFTMAAQRLPHKIGLVIPQNFNDRTTSTHRDAINSLCRSVFGVVIQNSDFEIQFEEISPARTSSILQFLEDDILDFDVVSDSSKVIKTATVTYRRREFNAAVREASEETEEHTSDIAQYLGRSTKEIEIDTVLYSLNDAAIAAQRWAFTLELSRTLIEFQTKLRAARLKVTDKIGFKHDLLFERMGASERRRVMELRAARKTAVGTQIGTDDIGAALNRCSVIGPMAHPNFEDSSADEKLFSGYITDSYGMIDNEAETHGLNVIW